MQVFAAVAVGSADVESFDLKVLGGTWFVMAGWNPTFDCFPCSLREFEYHNEGGSLEATFFVPRNSQRRERI